MDYSDAKQLAYLLERDLLRPGRAAPRNSGHQCYMFAWTADDHLDDHGEYYRKWCTKWGKKWCFQLERGDEKKQLHYQGVISLKVKRRENELKALLREEGELPRRITVLSSNNKEAQSETFYVTKPDGRVEGPWSDKDEEVFIQDSVKAVENKLYPWQRTILNHRNDFQERLINVIVDKEGAQGKSTLASLIDQKGYGYRIFVQDPERLVSSVCDMLMATKNRNPKLFILDMPRSANQRNPHQVFSAIEMIKDGYAIDTRYHYKKWVFNQPQVWIFCNRMPDAYMLSLDRWVYWQISVDRELVPFDPNSYEVDRHPGPPRTRSPTPEPQDVDQEVKSVGEDFLGASLSLHRKSSW